MTTTIVKRLEGTMLALYDEREEWCRYRISQYTKPNEGGLWKLANAHGDLLSVWRTLEGAEFAALALEADRIDTVLHGEGE